MLMTTWKERGMKMGLDFSIEAHFHREKDNKVDDFDIEIGYFRKFWELRSEIMNVASKNEDEILDTQDDFLIETTPDVLPRVIDCLLEACKDREHIFFEDSIWNEVCGRGIVLRQLQRMSNWDNLFIRLPDILNENDPIARDCQINYANCRDAIENIVEDGDCNLSYEEFCDILLHLEDWKITLRFYNSY